MIIKINGKSEDVGQVRSLGAIIEAKSLNPLHIVVEHNFNIAPRERWNDIMLSQDDTIEIISFVGGG